MSKEELLPLLDQVVYNRFDTRVKDTFLTAMIAAYNKAISDAVSELRRHGEFGYIEAPSRVLFDELESLKIKD